MGKIIKGLVELVGGVVVLIFIIRAINDKTPDAKTPPQVVVTPHAIGEEFSVGYWAYRCEGAKWLPFIGTGYSMERPNAAFLLVEITAQNNDTSASTLPPFHLIDSAGRIYDQSSSGILVNGIISPLESLNPSVSKHGYLLFDVPANRLYTLQVGGGYESEQSALAALFAPPSPTSGAPSPAPNSNDAKPVHKPIVEGLAESPVHAVIYEDLQFPDCAAFHRMMEEKLLPRYGAKVAFVHRDFPLGSHTWARRAAIAARFFSDRKPELGLEYRSYMMAGQQATNADNFNERLASFAKAHDIEPEAAIAALSNARYGETVEQDFQEGVSRGVVHTPTVFVNGKPFVGTFTFEEISKGIDEAIAQAR